jgi:hypothetical protein
MAVPLVCESGEPVYRFSEICANFWPFTVGHFLNNRSRIVLVLRKMQKCGAQPSYMIPSSVPLFSVLFRVLPFRLSALWL